MQIYDLIMIGVLAAAVVFGAWKGLAWQVASLASLVISYFAALRFSGQLAPYISDQEPFNRFVAMLIIYVVTGMIVWFLFRLVADFMDRLRLKEFDRQMGALVGLAKGVLLCIAITFFAVTLTEDPYRQSIMTSRSGNYIGYVLDRAHLVMPDEVHGVLRPYLDRLDEQLDHQHVEFDENGQPIDVHSHDGHAPITAEIPAHPNLRSR